MFDWRNLTPGVIFARVLDIKCQNCGAYTAGLLLDHCSRCGYPAPTALNCPQCGLKIARKKLRQCPRCGASVIGKTAGTDVLGDANSRIVETLPAPASSPEPAAELTPPPVLAPVPPAPENPAVKTADALLPVEMSAAPPAAHTDPGRLPQLGEESTITIAQLARLIGDKNGAGLQEHTGKTIRLKGIIREVNTGMPDDVGAGVVVLMSPEAAVSFTVGCRFGAVYRSVLSRMQLGQRITVLGIVNLADSEVTLEDCMPVG